MANTRNSFLCSMGKVIKELWQRSHNKYLQQQAIQQQNMLNACIGAMADQMAVDLYEALHDKGYPLLSPLYTPQSIRFNGCSCVNGCYKFIFCLDKKSENKIIALILSEMKDRMNRDIASTQRKMARLYEYEYVYNTYPFLFHGIYVSAVQDLKMSEITLTVQTNLTPQNFVQLYRQTF